MKRRNQSWCTLLVAAAWGTAAAAQGSVTIKVDQPGFKISPTLYGMMTEEINHSYDGGLYAELIRNRTFQEDPALLLGWDVVTSEGATGAIALDDSNPVNTGALAQSLRIDLTQAKDNERVGAANGGYWGIPVWPNTKYRASFYARADRRFTGPLKVDIESNDGATVYASATIDHLSTSWQKYTLTLSTSDVPVSTKNRFVVSGSQPGTVWLSLVSLFPPTYHDRPNGNRIDIMQKFADLHPSFLRFPGGGYLEGAGVRDRFAWETTLGPLEKRRGHGSVWGYASTDGMGLLEFLEWCEDLHMEPVLGVFDNLWARDPDSSDVMPFVREALDEIEYVTGDANTKWGKVRAKDGHPAPFTLHYVEIGNEEGGPDYETRYAMYYDAIKAKYPQLQIIATAHITKRTPDVVDDHYYTEMAGITHHYDTTSRSGPKIFIGEWATMEGTPTPNLKAALSDAAWLTGVERNSDVIVMTCYAPLLVNVNKGAWQWSTNLIGYDAARSFGSPSYYVQVMFAKHRGDVILPTDLDVPAPSGPQALAQVYATASRDTATGNVELKVVNTGGTPQSLEIHLTGVQSVEPQAATEVLSGQPDDVNSVDEPEKIVPKHADISDAAPNFSHEFPAYSVTTIVFKVK